MWFNTLGVMVDCSRNAVPRVDELKRFFAVLSKMGYNQVQLYMEDTYEVEGEPLFGKFRGRYTQADLKELDDAAFALGIELVPCVQALAHFTATMRWEHYQKMRDIDEVLMVGEESTYAFIDRLLGALRPCFRTDKIHIGMDEAWRLGKGRYRDVYGEKSKHDILLDHLERVMPIVRKYGYKPMIWSDMFFRSISPTGSYYIQNPKFEERIRAMIPEDVTLVYWDYYRTKKAQYVNMLRGHKQLAETERLMFAGGAWKWSGFTPHNDFSIRANKASIVACREEGIRDIFFTMWGDNGSETPFWSVLPSLCHAACLAQDITDTAAMKEKFYEWVGVKYDDFIRLDLPDRIDGKRDIVDPSKIALYNDCFMGLFDSTVHEGHGAQFAKAARLLRSSMKRAGEYAYLFDTLAKLCSVLEIKAEIGLRTRAAYAAGDRDALGALVAEYAKMIKRTEAFYRAFRYQWHHDNRPQGFEVHDIRLGGLIGRMKHCRERLQEYLDGKWESLPELAEENITEYGTEVRCYNSWGGIVSRNVL